VSSVEHRIHARCGLELFGQAPDEEQAILPLPYINMSKWDDEPVPEQEWGVPNRFPLYQAAVLSGEGAGGKSTLALQLGVAHVLGRDWLGSLPEQGPAIVIDAFVGDRSMGNRDGEEDYEAPSVDERGRSYAQDARTREGKDDCNRA
jgi:AAA domain